MSTTIEGIGSFYLGRIWDDARAAASPELLLYEASDLNTHAVCVGMTGSGKTGLCVDLIEEAAIDGVPAIVVDLKGDLSNLALSFPSLTAADFEPWIDPAEARQAGNSVGVHAALVAARWKEGLAAWGQGPERIARLRARSEIALFTPASEVGLPISILGTLAAPPPALRADPEALRERVLDTVSGLLSLAGIDADPVRSREHVFLSTLVDGAWRAGQSLSLESLIAAIQSPGFTRVGVLDLEAFYPAKDRFELVLALNGLLAAPGFSAWRTGEPLSIERLLAAPDGRPRISILSLAHLGERERTFFLTLLLSQIVGWMRTQPGTASLRALLYLDEVYGLLPPSANPPTKGPLLTLLKQARAYGLGLLLATQNPVDLDYKALSNAGTWFLGRLATERDQQRVLDGLEQSGAALDRAEMSRVLAGLPQRCFVMRNVHEDAPVLFQSRWALSYLRGPLTRPQLLQLKEKGLVAAGSPAAPASPVTVAPTPAAPVAAAPGTGTGTAGSTVAPAPAEGFEVVYALESGEDPLEPWILAEAHVHFARAKDQVDEWATVELLVAPGEGPEPGWDSASVGERGAHGVGASAPAGASYAELPRMLSRPKAKASLEKKLEGWLYRSQRVVRFSCAPLKLRSQEGESREAFAGRVALALREERDAQAAKVKAAYAKKFESLRAKIAKAEDKVAAEADQLQYAEQNRTISVGTTLLGAVFGRKMLSVGNASRAGSAMRSQSRVTREREEVERAKEKLAALQAELTALDAEARARLAEAAAQAATAELPPIHEVEVPPRKTDTEVVRLAVCWRPKGA
ncbi:MAG: DUF853 family protein [Deltaproteobacteria bacterium]|nr:DUF853 family protein [Deltaproteobacteria bacterium]